MKRFLSALIFILPFFYSYADWDMMVCDSVDDKKNCIGKSGTFVLPGQELHLKVLLANAGGLHTDNVFFEVYRMDTDTYAENLLSTAEAKAEPNQLSVWQTLSFTQKGHYIIKARDAYKDYITSRELEIK